MDDAPGEPRLAVSSKTSEPRRRKWSRPIDQSRAEATRQLLWQAFRHGELSDAELGRELDRLRFAHDMLEWRDPLAIEPPAN
jgi:hypothetical protein